MWSSGSLSAILPSRSESVSPEKSGEETKEQKVNAHACHPAMSTQLSDPEGRDEAGEGLRDSSVSVRSVGRVEFVGVSDPVEIGMLFYVVKELQLVDERAILSAGVATARDAVAKARLKVTRH